MPLELLEIRTEEVRPQIVFRGRKTSERDRSYNCVAWAFRRSDRYWWPPLFPDPDADWPLSVVDHGAANVEMQAFFDLFAEWGWEECGSGKHEAGIEKIALYVQGDGLYLRPSHLARMITDDSFGSDAIGLWTSKLDTDIDALHALADLEGEDRYGRVYKIFRQPCEP